MTARVGLDFFIPHHPRALDRFAHLPIIVIFMRAGGGSGRSLYEDIQSTVCCKPAQLLTASTERLPRMDQRAKRLTGSFFAELLQVWYAAAACHNVQDT